MLDHQSSTIRRIYILLIRKRKLYIGLFQFHIILYQYLFIFMKIYNNSSFFIAIAFKNCLFAMVVRD